MEALASPGLGQMRIPDILETIADLSNDEVFTPPELANKVLDMLPESIWSDSSITFLDPATKTGIFLREITKRLIAGLEKEIPDLQERVNHILTKQVYGLGITELTTLMSRRTLYCSTTANGPQSVCTEFESTEGNIRFQASQHSFDKKGKCSVCGAGKDLYYEEEGLDNYAYSFLHDNLKEVFGDVKFDVIIGNPPYQLNTTEESGKNNASPLYNKFVEKALELSPKYISMIIPSRWYTGGLGLDDFRTLMLNEVKIRELYDFSNSFDCFKNVDISGGVCYFLIDSNYKGLPTINNVIGDNIISSMKRPMKEMGLDVFIRDNKSLRVFKKVSKSKEISFSTLIGPQTPFGITSSFKEYKLEPFENSVKIYMRNKCGYYIKEKDVLKNNSWIKSYKVYISKTYNLKGKFPEIVLNKPFLGEPNSCCSQTYLHIGPFKTKGESENVVSYMKTKFFRFMVFLIKNSQDNMARVFQCVPLQDFSKPWTDEELYKKYKLTEEEIAYIEENVEPME